jgi:flagellar motility protein MotE (MotC chaperone)
LPEQHSNTDELRERLWRLPGQLLLALINGTAILVIVAAILALVALSKVTHLADDVASTMTDAVLSRIDVKPQQVLADLQNVTTKVQELGKAFKQVKAEAPDRLDPEVAKLNERLGALQANIEQLREARSSLIDEAIARIGRALSETLQNLKGCKPTASQPTPG